MTQTNRAESGRAEPASRCSSSGKSSGSGVGSQRKCCAKRRGTRQLHGTVGGKHGSQAANGMPPALGMWNEMNSSSNMCSRLGGGFFDACPKSVKVKNKNKKGGANGLITIAFRSRGSVDMDHPIKQVICPKQKLREGGCKHEEFHHQSNSRCY